MYASIIVGASNVCQTVLSLVFEEPPSVVLSAVIGLKPLAQLLTRRGVNGHIGDAKQRLETSASFGVDAVTETFPMLVIYSTMILRGDKFVDWFQIAAIVSSLSTMSTHTANAFMAIDADPRLAHYYPAHYNFFDRSEQGQAKLGLRLR